VAPQRDRVLVFDVNETLLDLGALDPLFERTFGDAAGNGGKPGLTVEVSFLLERA